MVVTIGRHSVKSACDLVCRWRHLVSTLTYVCISVATKYNKLYNIASICRPITDRSEPLIMKCICLPECNVTESRTSRFADVGPVCEAAYCAPNYKPMQTSCWTTYEPVSARSYPQPLHIQPVAAELATSASLPESAATPTA